MALPDFIAYSFYFTFRGLLTAIDCVCHGTEIAGILISVYKILAQFSGTANK